MANERCENCAKLKRCNPMDKARRMPCKDYERFIKKKNSTPTDQSEVLSNRNHKGISTLNLIKESEGKSSEGI